MRTRKSPADVRRESAALAREVARDRDATGDPEGAGVLRALADRIARLRLTSDAR